MSNNNGNNFTFVEILIVVAILVIVAVLLWSFVNGTSLSSSGLGHQTLNLETRVQVPVGTPTLPSSIG